MILLLVGFHLTHQKGRAASTNSHPAAALPHLWVSRHRGHLITALQREIIHQMNHQRSQLVYRQLHHNHARRGRPAPERHLLFPLPLFPRADRAGR
jgi:hypothetical protein